MSTKIYASPWKKIAENWSKFGDGNHPSLGNIKEYEKFFLKVTTGIQKPRVIVYGATPRLRDMLKRHNADVTVFDVNKEMIEAMTELMEESHEDETWIDGDWLNPPAALEQGSYHIIFGDQIKSNVSFEKQPTLYEEMASLLVPGGHHITKLTSRLPQTKHYDVEELIATYEHLEPNKENLTLFFNRLLFQTHHNNISGTNKMFAVLEKYLDRGRMQEYYDQLVDMLPSDKEWSVRPWIEEKAVIEKYFEIEDTAEDETLFYDSTYIYLFKKK